MLLLRGHEYWFEFVSEDDQPTEGICIQHFVVIRLSAELLAREHEIREEFQRHVSTGGDYVGGREFVLRPKEQHHLFYNKYLNYCRNRPFGDCEVIARLER